MSTYVPIQAITLSSPTTSVTFSGIPQTYTDLVLVCSVANSTNQQDVRINVNGDSGTNYSFTQVFGTGSSASSNRGSNYNWGLAGYIGTTQSNSITHFQNYSNTTTNKTMITRYNDPANLVVAAVSLWRSTAAINQIVVSFLANNFVAGSTFTLYGVGSGSPKAFGGDRVVTDGTYWYHAFLSSGRFEPVQNLSCDVLVVAGGGGGSSYRAGGGGAGGLRAFTSQSLTAQNYTVTVGAGGTGATQSGVFANGALGTNGSNSQFGSLTAATGGGRGGAGSPTTAGASGGSGGGSAADPSSQPNAGGAASPSGQGSAGGAGNNFATNFYGAGGGGGAGAVGSNGTSSGGGGAGGNGSSAYSSWGSATNTGQNISGTFWYAGGGAGGAFSGLAGGGAVSGGNGGGGSLAAFSSGQQISGGAGTANTGGGGAGSVSTDAAGNHGNGGAGGSGIVIVRYLV